MSLQSPIRKTGLGIVLTLASALCFGAHAVVLPSTDASLDHWAAKRITDRPGLPPLETRSPHAGTLSPDPGAATLLLMETHVADARAKAAATTAHALAEDQDNVVYATTFQAADGSTQEFAAHFRPDDARPLYLRASGYAPVANAGFEQAHAALIERALGQNTAGLRITALKDVFSNANQNLRAGRNPVTPPWPRCWVFFVDDHPLGEWEHPCRYVFIAEDLSAFAVQYGRSRLEAFAADGERVLFSLVVPHPVVDAPAPPANKKPAPKDPNPPADKAALDYSGSGQNCYAVIISGGADRYNNWKRYWNNCSQIYSTLRQKYQIPENHITVLMSDGTNAAADRNIGTDTDPVYANSDPDLDQDGDGDIDFACTHANVVNVLSNLQATLTSNDQLFIYITDHGYQESGHDAGVNLWNWEGLRDDELEDLTDSMACSVLIAMGTCYAGGFIDDFAASVNNRALATSCDWYESTWVGDTWPNYTQWLYHFSAGVRGFYPAAGPTPYQDGSACDADANNNNRVDFHEAWTYATAHKPDDNDPQWESNTAGFGDTVYLNHLHIELFHNSPVSYSQIPKDFSFRVPAGEWAAVGLAPSTDHNLQVDDNRQITSPYRASTYTGTTRDFVVANGHWLGDAVHYAQVYSGAASSYTVEAEYLPVNAVLGGAHSYTAASSEVFDLIEANLTAGTSYDVKLDITSGSPDLGIYVFAANALHGSRSTASWSRNAGGAGVDENLTFRPVVSGWHAIVMVNENGGSGDFTFTIAESPPLAAPTGVVATDGSYTDRVRVTWNSVTSATHYRVYRNTVNASGAATALNNWTAGTSFDDLTATAGRTYYYWVKAAASSEGDRESGFSALATGYVLPATLTSDAKVNTSSEPAYYRAGGETGCDWWWAAGVRRNVDGENWSLRLYSTPGFVTPLETSAYSSPVDFIVVDGNHVGAVYRGVEAYRFSGSGTASVEFEGAVGTSPETLSVNSTSTWSWTAGDVVEMYEVPLSAGTYRFTLNTTAGTADLDFALYGSGDGDYHRNRQHFLGSSMDGGAGAVETFICTVTNADDYGLCVWANDANSATYSLAIEQITSGIWTGTVSTNWFAAGNWQSGLVPTTALDATIPAGTPYSPGVGSGTANCRHLNLANGAALTINTNSTLAVAGHAYLKGQLRMMSGDSMLDVTGNVYWHPGSTADLRGTWPDIELDGILVLEDGSDANLANGHFVFRGSAPSYIRSFDTNCVLGWVQNLKDSTTLLGLSGQCTAPCRINYLYNASGRTFRNFSDEELLIGYYVVNGGRLQMDYGGLAFVGPCSATFPFTLTPGDRLNHLAMRGSGTLVLAATYTNTFPIQGSVELTSGLMLASNVNLIVGGNWSNAPGAARFLPGTNQVTFNAVGTQQRLEGTNVFYDLVDARSADNQLLLRGATTVQRDFAVNYQTAVYAPLTVQNTLIISNTACQLILWGSSDVQAAKLRLGGTLLVYSGSLAAADLLNNGLYGYININGGTVSLTQGTAAGDYFDLYGTLKLTGGRLDLIGGGADHYWPLSGTCVFEMNGGILDFRNQGWRIRSGFSGGITNGTLRCAENVLADTPAFAPVGGLLELYGPTAATLRQVPGSSFPSLLVNKTGTTLANMTTNLTITGNVELRSGVLKANTYTLNVAGNWTNGVGSAAFSEDTGTVRFMGDTAAGIQSDETFYRLELDKTYAAADGLVLANRVQVLNDLVLTDGTLRLRNGSALLVARDLLIANGAGLNARDRGAKEIHVGRHWSNLNTGFASTYGFDPGYDSLVVFDGGAVTGEMNTAAAVETFDAVRIDRPGGTLRVLDPVLLRDDLTILNGSFSYAGGPFTHRLRGNLTIETGGAWYDTASTVIFDGTVGQNLSHKSMNGWFKHLVVEKSTGIGIVPLTLQTNVLLLGGGTLTVREGYMDLNGYYVRCTGNVTVEDGGKLLVNEGAALEVGQTTLEIQGGGLLDVRGTATQPATVQAWNGGSGNRYAFLLRSNAVLRAQHAVFEHLDAGGVQVQAGAVVEEPFTFHNCVFRNGTSGGRLLDLQNAQALTIYNASFPSNPGGGASNVRKGKLGRADFVNATGAFAGELYDDDTFNLVDWHTGGLTRVSLAGPTTATLGGKYAYTATATGDIPLPPLTYYWTVTDHTPVTHSSSSLTDVLADRQWSTAGGKSVQVIVSNLLGTAQANLSVNVQPLDLAILGRQWVGATNAVNLLLKGTSAASTYQVQYRTNLTQGFWSNAIPDGVSIPGLNGQTAWQDLGGPGRNVTTATQLFYRVVLPSP